MGVEERQVAELFYEDHQDRAIETISIARDTADERVACGDGGERDVQRRCVGAEAVDVLEVMCEVYALELSTVIFRQDKL